MPKHHNKLTICPNCGTSLDNHENFCPTCGQENHEVKLPLGHIAYEFVESITHFDNKLWNSLKAIFTRPGKMTAEFLEGKRMRYVPPARLYVFVSVIFFFLIGKFADHQLEEANVGKGGTETTDSTAVNEISLRKLIQKDSLLRSRQLYKIAREIEVKTPFNRADLAKTARRIKQLKPTGIDSLLTEAELERADSNRTKLRELIALIPDKPTVDVSISMPMSDKKFKTEEELRAYEKELQIMPDSKIDSLIRSQSYTPNWLFRKLYRRQGKLSELGKGENIHEFLHAITKNLSVVMFVLMPFVGILLLLFYFRRGRFYYEHLIFSVHIHTVIFLLFSLALMGTYFAGEDLTSSVLYWIFWICWLYFLLSLKRVYQQGWGKTLLKFFLLSLMYSITLALFVAGATLMGLLTF